MSRNMAAGWAARSVVLALLLVGNIFLGGWPAFAGEVGSGQNLAADLNLVPRGAAGFVHLRAADLWRSAWAKDIRYLLDKAGPEAWKAFEKQCPLDPSTLDRITVILLTPKVLADPFPTADPEALSALVVVRTTQPYDRRALIQALGRREKVYRHHVYYFNEELWSGLLPTDDRTFLIGSEEALVQFFEIWRQPAGGPLTAALAKASGKHQVVAGWNPALLAKAEGAQFLPPSLQKLLEAHCGMLTLDLDQGIHLHLRLEYTNEDGAKEGQKALRDTLELARLGLTFPITELEKLLHKPGKTSPAELAQNFAALVALGFLRELDSLLKEAPIQRQQAAVELPLKYQKLDSTQQLALVSFAGTASLASFSARARLPFFADKEKSEKDPVEEHLRNLSKALDKHHEKHGTYPPPALYDPDGRPTLSWRVALLPDLGEEGLYREFKLDEPWDSLHNKRLLKKLPRAFQNPNSNRYYYGDGSRWKTATQVFAGPNTLFAGKQGLARKDAAKQTILLAYLEEAQDHGVYWTKPHDLAYAPDQRLPDLFGQYGNRFRALLADGTIRAIDKSMDEKTLRSMIQSNGTWTPRAAAKKPSEETGPLEARDLEIILRDFQQNDEAGTHKAWQDMARLVHMPQLTVPFLKARLQRVPPVDSKQVARLLADLDSGNFKTRNSAMGELKRLGELAVPAIGKKLADKGLTLEMRRRLEDLMKNPKSVLSGPELRAIRAIEVLEGIGTPDAGAVLEHLASGGEGAVLAEHAKRALTRLGRAAGK